jgi:hypothetical protein
VGWLDGVPATDRDVANRLVLDRRVTDLQALEDDYRRRIAALEAQRPDPSSAEANEHDNEPSDADFGANRDTTDTHGHSAYWTPGSESLGNHARVVVGQYGAVGLEHGSAPQP